MTCCVGSVGNVLGAAFVSALELVRTIAMYVPLSSGSVPVEERLSLLVLPSLALVMQACTPSMIRPCGVAAVLKKNTNK